MDYVRSCYITRARLYPDSDETVRMVWFFAAKNAKLYPHYHRFGSGNWAREREDWDGPGEVLGAGRPYWKGVTPEGKDGHGFHGPVAGFSGELPMADAVGLPLGLDGSPKCGEPDKGGVAVGKRSSTFLRPSPWWLRRGPCAYRGFPTRILWRIDNGFTLSKMLLTWDGLAYWRGAGTYQRRTAPFGNWVTLPAEFRLSGTCANQLEIMTQATGLGWQPLFGGPSLFPPFPWDAGTRVYGSYPYPALSAEDDYAAGDTSVSLGDYEMIGRPPPIVSTGDPALGGRSQLRGRHAIHSDGGSVMGGRSIVAGWPGHITSAGGLAAGGSSATTGFSIRYVGGPAIGGSSATTRASRTISSAGGPAIGGSSAMPHTRTISSAGGPALGDTSRTWGGGGSVHSAGGLAAGGSASTVAG